MALRKLTKRKYLGEGYVHQFVNNRTKQIVFIPCTKLEYEQLGQRGGKKYAPKLFGHTWANSAGGTIKVDTPDTMLGKNEYTDLPDGRKAVYVPGNEGDVREQFVASNAIDINDNLDDTKLKVPVKIISKR